MSIAVPVVLLLCSMSGYMLLGAKRLGWHIALTPAIFFAFVSAVMTFAGYVGCMELAAGLLYVGGFVAWGWVIAKKQWPTTAEWCYALVFLLLCVYAVARSFSAVFVAYDNYSHWATVVKTMLHTNQMPTAADQMVTYRTYPLGSSLVLYFVCRVTLPTDAFMQLGQMLMRVSLLFSLASLLNKKNAVVLFGIAAYGVFGVHCRISPVDLLVDAILPMAAVAGMAVVYKHRDEPQKALIPFSLLMCLVCGIKQSGITLSPACALLALWLYRKQLCRQPLRYLAALVGAPTLYYALWIWHTTVTFPQSSSQYHMVSLDYYQKTFAGKTQEDVAEIVSRFWNRMWQDGQDTLCVLLVLSGMLALFSLVCLLSRKPKQILPELGYTVLLLALIALYDAGVLGMYVFSMSGAEALALNSFERYIITGLLLALGLMCIRMMVRLPEIEAVRWPAARCVLAVAMALVMCLPLAHRKGHIPQLYLSQDEPLFWESNFFWDKDYYVYRKTAEAFETAIPTRAGDRLLVYAASGNTSYAAAVTRHLFWDQKVGTSSEPEDALARLGSYDYLLVYTDGADLADAAPMLGERLDIPDGRIAYKLR